MRSKSVSIALGFVFLAIPLVSAEKDTAVPEFLISERLRPYADEKTVTQNARTVIELLQGAEFHKQANGFDPGCDTPEVESFYRGMHLAHLAYYLFISKQEVGWFEDQSPTQAEPPRAFVDFGRSALLRLWTPRMLLRLLDISSSVNKLPVDRRADLIAFLTMLREFRAYRTDLQGSRNQLDALYKRLYDDRTLRYWRVFLPSDGVEGLKREFPQDTPMNFDAELRELINKVRGPELPAIGACYEAGAPYMLTLKDDRNISSGKFLLPIFYMLRFWDRREAEGTADVADFLLSQAVSRIHRK